METGCASGDVVTTRDLSQALHAHHNAIAPYNHAAGMLEAPHALSDRFKTEFHRHPQNLD